MKLSKKGMRGIARGGDNLSKIFMVAYLDSGEIFWWGSVPFPFDKAIITPEEITLDLKIRVKTVSCGELHCAVLSEDGKVFTCGRNDVGQLGHEAFTKQEVTMFSRSDDWSYWDPNGDYDVIPSTYSYRGTSTLSIVKGIIEEQTVIDVSCGYDFTVVLLNDGKVAAWGRNDYGQLGIGKSGSPSMSPVGLVSLSTYHEAIIDKIVSGKCHVLALSETGTLYVWGSNSHGQRGMKNMPHRKNGCPSEVKVDDLRFTDIDASYLCNISVAECENGEVYFWGETIGGQVFEPTKAAECKSIDDVFVSLATPKVMVRPMRRLEDSHSELDVTREMSLLETLQNEFNNPDSSDLTIVVDEKKIYVHQSILKMRSKYFNVLIARWLEENKRILEIKEKSFAAIETYLKFLYTDKLEADLILAIELLQLADEYGETKLKFLCRKIIQKDMKTHEVADIFANSRKMENCELLNRFSLEYALRHSTEMINSPGFEMLDADAMKDLFREYVKIKGNCL